ncbi:DUF1284 domain-containing protein [Clostridium estertheticum]|uniref:DUF1284 domain-containing protein n=1 Tax=Clostridium estertheticum TaxID=238834 RepID=A0AA47EEV7_9CLOT|nr:DUF1284 domain-containing protein [Clostridium estertheticum]MBU3156462.1 DUF1284 domain-containing protein [Clostridium estertheticum]MBU3199874.1 DUF1284 domain-containing protein [Clostridium estertheticum]WAG58918.1 DUF1284 domain-containing protein [Clostridium estertheticum]
MLILRAHHLLCIQGYKGKGYSLHFTDNMDKVVNKLKDNTCIRVVTNTDDICVACPHNFKNGFCESDEKVFVFDSKVLNELKLIEGRTYLYKDILNNIRENLTYEKFLKICKSCYWFSYGYCFNKLKKH